MIKKITIENFRCFDKLKVLGFERVNLISGKNNAGKTALLEAIFLNSAPRADTIFLLRQVRREQASFSKALPERTWSNFFFEQNEDNTISIEAILENGDSKVVDISIEETLKSMLVQDSYQEDKDSEEKSKSQVIFSATESSVSAINVSTRLNNLLALKYKLSQVVKE
ncbi:MAG: AAA family ATPase [Pseudanabaena sp.]